ncbi:MAG TPA: arginine--tRNA ligase, partial [Patescibacteria group bacterium]
MTIKEQLTRELKKVLIELNLLEIEPSVTYPTDPKFGDYATNVALIAAKKLSKNPRELAQEIINSGKWQMVYGKWLEKMEVAGPGFINFFIKKEALLDIIATSVSVAIPKTGEGKKVMVEFAHPNTHKAFHIGHLRNITTGESIVRLLEAVGVKVIRANYQGDVGMHIAKAIYGLTMLVGEDKVDTKDLIVKDYSNDIDRVLNTIKSLNSKNIHERIAILGQAYAYGSELYEKHGVDQAAINQIKKINSSIYND